MYNLHNLKLYRFNFRKNQHRHLTVPISLSLIIGLKLTKRCEL